MRKIPRGIILSVSGSFFKKKGKKVAPYLLGWHFTALGKLRNAAAHERNKYNMIEVGRNGVQQILIKAHFHSKS